MLLSVRTELDEEIDECRRMVEYRVLPPITVMNSVLNRVVTSVVVSPELALGVNEAAVEYPG